MFSKKFAFLLVCMGTLSRSMDTPETQMTKKQPLYLVATSTDKSLFQDSFLFKKLWSEDSADVSYANTYGGNATIVDLDSLVFDAAGRHDLNKYDIASAYVVQSPTPYSYTNEINYFKRCIQHIGKNMKQGAKLEIELHPSIEIVVDNMDTVQSIFDEQHMKSDPFAAVINSDLVCRSFQMACGKPLPSAIAFPEKFIAYAQKLSRTLENMITIYAEKKIGTKEQLTKRIMEELWLWTRLANSNQLALLSHGPTANFEDFSNALKKFHFIETPISLKDEVYLQQQYNAISYDALTFLNDSLFSLMLCDAAIIHGTKCMEEFMHNNGFENVWLSRTSSKRNGRTNVWIIEGTKA